MAEPDHIIVKPIPNLSGDGRATAFRFFYIEPKKYETALHNFPPEYEGPITKIDPIGNSPVIIEKVYPGTTRMHKFSEQFCKVDNQGFGQ
jgi:hydroxyproline O-arabinosyltransferase